MFTTRNHHRISSAFFANIPLRAWSILLVPNYLPAMFQFPSRCDLSPGISGARFSTGNTAAPAESRVGGGTMAVRVCVCDVLRKREKRESVRVWESSVRPVHNSAAARRRSNHSSRSIHPNEASRITTSHADGIGVQWGGKKQEKKIKKNIRKQSLHKKYNENENVLN